MVDYGVTFNTFSVIIKFLPAIGTLCRLIFVHLFLLKAGTLPIAAHYESQFLKT